MENLEKYEKIIFEEKLIIFEVLNNSGINENELFIIQKKLNFLEIRKKFLLYNY